MSSIGYSPGIGSGFITDIGAARAVGAADPGVSTQSDGAVPGVPVVSSTALDAGPAPVDQDRVDTIKKAIADNDYPLVPTKIGDAMIAAGMLLRMAK